MEAAKSTKINGRIVYSFINCYNQDASVYNRYHRGKSGNQELDIIRWNDTVTALEKMSDADLTRCKAAISQANKVYYDTLEKEVYPLLLDILKLPDVRDLW